MTKHYTLLREYFVAVTRDMLTRGVIRRQSGVDFPAIFRAEGWTILKEVEGDLAEMLKELGVTTVTGAASYVEHLAQQGIGAASGWAQSLLGELFSGPPKRPRR